MSKQLAIMSKPKFGMRDMSHPAFWFDVRFGEELSSGALIIIDTERFAKIVEEANTYDVESLKDAPCRIEVDSNNTVRFIKVLKA